MGGEDGGGTWDLFAVVIFSFPVYDMTCHIADVLAW